MISNNMQSLQMSQPFISDKILSILHDSSKNSKILDIATGMGYLLEILKENGYSNLYSADINEDNFKFNKEEFHFSKIDANKLLPYKDGEFDIVICSETIEHVENPRELLREFHRILIKGGILILTTPNVETIFSRIYFLFTSGLVSHTKDDYELSGHISILPSWLIERFTYEIGFKKLMKNYNCGYIPILKFKTKNILLNILFGWISIYKFSKI